MNTEDLEAYQRKLLDMRDRSRDEIDRLIQVVLDNASAAGEHDRCVSESVDKELALEQTEEAIRDMLGKALERIEAGSYGDCQLCGDTIPKVRLDAIPFTPYCVNCERRREE